jgi:LmbE family N-acetylglucosaminyl deacetylase
MMRLAVLSPHYDDAVLSCWHVLRARESVVVVNVFAGVPAEGSPLGWWDRRTGANDSPGRVRARAHEDRAALAFAARSAVDLDILEWQYRVAPVTPAFVAEQIASVLGACDTLYAPLALDAHVDHVLAREAALCLRSTSADVRLYADLPHGLTRGWPTWVARDGRPEVDATWARATADAVPCGLRLHRDVRELPEDERRRKLEAVRAYRTQLAELEAMAFAPLADCLRYEVVWDLMPA